jgi:hypothetical protein
MNRLAGGVVFIDWCSLELLDQSQSSVSPGSFGPKGNGCQNTPRLKLNQTSLIQLDQIIGRLFFFKKKMFLPFQDKKKGKYTGPKLYMNKTNCIKLNKRKYTGPKLKMNKCYNIRVQVLHCFNIYT